LHRLSALILAREARLMTDEFAAYTTVGREFAEHGVVQHMLVDYVKGDTHTNTIEGFFSIFKCGTKASTSIAGITTCIAT
jgi:ISXO2-like transposase domain